MATEVDKYGNVVRCDVLATWSCGDRHVERRRYSDGTVRYFYGWEASNIHAFLRDEMRCHYKMVSKEEVLHMTEHNLPEPQRAKLLAALDE